MAIGDSVLVIAVSVTFSLMMGAIALGPSLLRDIRARRLLARGLTARARIIDLRDTGNRFNGQPEIAISVAVDPAEGARFEARVVRVLSVADAECFARGKTITVRYDPAHPDRVAIVARAD